VLHASFQGHPQGIAVVIWPINCLHGRDRAQPFADLQTRPSEPSLPLPAEGADHGSASTGSSTANRISPAKPGDHTAENGLKPKIFEAGGQLGRRREMLRCRMERCDMRPLGPG